MAKSSRANDFGGARYGAAKCPLQLLRHSPGLQGIALLTQFCAHLFDQPGQLVRVRIDAAGYLFTAQLGAGFIDHSQAEFASAGGRIPGHTLERLESVVGNQQCFVGTERGVHGVGLSMCPNMFFNRCVNAAVRLLTCTDVSSGHSSHTPNRKNMFFSLRPLL